MLTRARARARVLLAIAGIAVAAVVGLTSPASAQQFIDGSEDGGGAFLWFAGMCFLFVAIMFGIDRVRRRKGGGE